MGTGGLWFLAVSASAPMTVVAGSVVATYGGTGVVGVPLSFLALGLVLWLLSVGYVAMSRHVGHAAPFYALLARGFGRAWGLAAAVVALLGYNAIQISLYGLLGATLAGAVGGTWWWWAALVWAAIAACGVLRVDIGARLVSVLLVFEIAVIGLFILGAFMHPAGGHVSMVALLPSRLLVNGIGGVLALSIAGFVGFESGPAYGEEARTDRSVGRATVAALAFLGPLYALGSWAMVVAVGPDRVVANARQDPNLVFTIMDHGYGILGPLVAGAGSLLLVTSMFAAMVSFHGTVARYLFGLARERVLPVRLARTGAGRGSRRDAPIAGSLVQSAIAAVVVGVFAVTGADPVSALFAWLAALAALALLALLVATSGAAMRWFRTVGEGCGESRWSRVVAPALGLAAGLGVLIVTTVNLGALLGVAGFWLTAVIPGTVVAAIVIGLVWAGVLRRRRRGVYDGIGRGRPHPLAVVDRRLDEVSL
jgi:amino acid transporter